MKKFAIIILIAASPACVFGFGSAPAFSVMNIGLGARGISMANAFTTIANDVTASYWNPAGLAQIKDVEASLAHNQWFLDSYFEYLSVCLPLGTGTLGLNAIYVNMGEFDDIDEDGYLTGEIIVPYSIGALASYGMTFFDAVSAGASAKVINQVIGSDVLSSVMFDIGVIYKQGDLLSVGAVAKNLGVGDGFSVPTNIKGGVAIDALRMENQKLLIAAEASYQPDVDLVFNFGVEYMLFDMIALRGGYSLRPSETGLGSIAGLSGGFGAEIGSFRLDYAFASYGNLGHNHIATLSFKYAGPDAPDEVEKEYTEKEISKGEDITAGLSLARFYYDEGVEYCKLSNFVQAIKEFRKAKNLEPDNDNIDRWIGYAETMLKKERAKEKRSEADELVQEAMKHMNSCEYSVALDILNRVMEIDKTNKKAAEYMEKAAAEIEKIEMYTKRAKKNVKKGKVVEAVKDYRKVLLMCSNYAGTVSELNNLKDEIEKQCKEFYLMGLQKYTMGDIDDAIDCWESISRLDPKNEYNRKAKENIKEAKEKKSVILENVK